MLSTEWSLLVYWVWPSYIKNSQQGNVINWKIIFLAPQYVNLRWWSYLETVIGVLWTVKSLHHLAEIILCWCCDLLAWRRNGDSLWSQAVPGQSERGGGHNWYGGSAHSISHLEQSRLSNTNSTTPSHPLNSFSRGGIILVKQVCFNC